MHPFPHRYSVQTQVRPAGDVLLESAGVDALRTAKPVEFDGPGDLWSPETLLVGAVIDCYVITFRGIAAASKLPWVALACEVDGTLDRVDRVTRFTHITVRARLQVPPEANVDQARRILQRAEETCLITRSLSAETTLDAEVDVLAPVMS